ncbi:MAG: cytochrome c biogenesis protein ResB, partial [Candidatus Omnitrophota bacterium]|nr:cytochrome c biogenesis protein ResB [Candidatus Omnitrophota bacterium]
DNFIYNENIDSKERLLVYQRTISEKGVCDMRNPQVGKDTKGFLAEIPVNMGIEQDIGNTGYKIKVIRYVCDFVIDTSTKIVSSRSAMADNPALEVELRDPKGAIKSAWLFARFPDIHQEISGDFKIIYNWAPRRPKDFISKVTILKAGKEVLKRDIQVNAPLNFAGYNFFQSSYDSQDLSWSGLQVVKDPGVPVIYAGFVLLILGLVMIFYVGPLTKG